MYNLLGAAMVAVKHDDLSLAFDFVSYAAPTEHNAYVSLDTGKIYWTSDSSDALDEEIPDDLETSDRYLAIPHRNELDLGRRLALRFVAQELPARYDQVEGLFRRQGAYARFKDLLDREGVLERWYSFETDAVESALRQWCAENGLKLLEM
ncbi:hypothetical protein B0G81_8512 [Paraburkholderia sp. BL6665CI2N2]|uniref:hypothetical protein n=1 Tax=Paraburkholderia sp. BL6665CI2N2 TaxID=1938806 RepID=UPI0010E87AE1|nr:hypothetical protein [Paraburkholderia sp. BL6665CI2N2]TDY15512.1 hypothetical protein B0G81_8560 [Paraburkholderia sp. BL6665CI2N2]TDY16648.1 hypothetical protein B0G81_7716 [Paraburkholderia sp. BL6665CI2N2]TDY17256.1 hypothetical protein B0G81_8512 [Paraburkholderia sp. BL6665CI2N2]